MSANGTTLVGAITSDQTLITLAAGTGAAVGKELRIDSEKTIIQNVDASPVIKVARGQRGTAAVAHATGAAVTIAPPAEFPVEPPPRQYTYGIADAIIRAPGTHLLNTGAASAMTIADPDLGMDNLELEVVAATAHAYTVAGVFNAGGGGADLITLGGAVGDGFGLRARQGKWIVLYRTGATIS